MIYYRCHAKVFSSEKMILVPCESRLKGTRIRSLSDSQSWALVGRPAIKEKESSATCAKELSALGSGTHCPSVDRLEFSIRDFGRQRLFPLPTLMKMFPKLLVIASGKVLGKL